MRQIYEILQQELLVLYAKMKATVFGSDSKINKYIRKLVKSKATPIPSSRKSWRSYNAQRK